MKCEELIDTWLTGPAGAVDDRLLAEHLAACPGCRDALHAAERLAEERAAHVPGPPAGAFERAIDAAVGATVEARSARARPRRGFWLGTAVGGAVAAAVALVAVLAVGPSAYRAVPSATPAVVLSLNETREVNIGLDTSEALPDAEIRVVLSGAIGLQGFEDRQEVRWSADLEPGVNELTLPITALGDAGGQVLVEVRHGQRRRAFVVDVRTSADVQGV